MEGHHGGEISEKEVSQFFLSEAEIPQGSYIWNEIIKAKFLAKSKAK